MFCRIGVSGMISATPSAMISIVTMLETAVEMVEMISPSSLLALTPASSIHEIAHGTLRLDRLPVTNARYELPAPSMGIYVTISIMPTVQKMGATPTSPFATPTQSGIV